MSEQVEEAKKEYAHALDYDFCGYGWMRIVCKCGAQSDAEERSNRGSKRLAKWIAKHTIEHGEVDAAGLA